MPKCGLKSITASEVRLKNLKLLRTVKTMSGQICTRISQRQPMKKGSELAAKFRAVGEIEKHHEERYRAFLKNVETAQVFEKSEVKV